MNNSFFDSLRILVATEDALEPAIAQLGAFLSDGERSLRNEALGLSGRMASAARRRRRNERSSEEVSAERSMLRTNVLEFIDEVERVSARPRLPFPELPVAARWPPEAVDLEKIIGDNRLKSIAWLRRGLDVTRSVCRIKTSSGRGTGFFVEGNFVVTNFHVLPSRDEVASAVVECGVEEDLDGKLLPAVTYRLDASTWVSSAAMDCAMACVRVSDAPDLSAWGSLRWAPNGHEPVIGDYVSIIQHPSGGPKKIAISENQVVNVYEHRLQYTTDTLPGSSGAPVFNDAWEVVAVHHAGGNLVTSPSGIRRYINEGILSAQVQNALGLV